MEIPITHSDLAATDSKGHGLEALGHGATGHGTTGHGSHEHHDMIHAESDNINTGLLSVIFALSAVSVVLVVVLLQVWFYNLTNAITAERAPLIDDPQSLLGTALIDYQKQIKDYHWVNREAQIRAIPIDRAMQLVTKELGSASSAAATHAEKENLKP